MTMSKILEGFLVQHDIQRAGNSGLVKKPMWTCILQKCDANVEAKVRKVNNL